MLHKTQGIVLHHIKYSETSVVAYLYTREFGRQAYLINSVRRPKANARPALFQPLFLLNMEVYHRPKQELQRLKEVSIAEPFTTIPYDIAKSAITFFLSELLYKTLREEHHNYALFDYIYFSILHLDKQPKANPLFHLQFMLFLSRYLGFFPDTNYSEKRCFFDLQNGLFDFSIPMHKHYLEPPASDYLIKLMTTSLEDLNKISVPKEIRTLLLDKLIEYFRLHIENLGEMQTPDILAQTIN